MSKLYKVTVSIFVFADGAREAADAVTEAITEGVIMSKQVNGEDVEEVFANVRLRAAPLGHDDAEHGFHYIPEVWVTEAKASTATVAQVEAERVEDDDNTPF
jgi:hypothetical protein